MGGGECVCVCVYCGVGEGWWWRKPKKLCQGEEMTPEDVKDTEVLIDAFSP